MSKRNLSFDIKHAYPVTSMSLPQRRWCHTNFKALPPYEKYFIRESDGISYAIWQKCVSPFSGDSVIQGYVEFFQPKTRQELYAEFNGYWNEAHFDAKTNKMYCVSVLHDSQREDGPWEIGEVEHETETETILVAIQYEPPPSEEEQSEEEIDWESQPEDPDSEEIDRVKKKLKGSGYFIADEALESDN